MDHEFEMSCRRTLLEAYRANGIPVDLCWLGNEMHGLVVGVGSELVIFSSLADPGYMTQIAIEDITAIIFEQR